MGCFPRAAPFAGGLMAQQCSWAQRDSSLVHCFVRYIYILDHRTRDCAIATAFADPASLHQQSSLFSRPQSDRENPPHPTSCRGASAQREPSSAMCLISTPKSRERIYRDDAHFAPRPVSNYHGGPAPARTSRTHLRRSESRVRVPEERVSYVSRRSVSRTRDPVRYTREVVPTGRERDYYERRRTTHVR